LAQGDLLEKSRKDKEEAVREHQNYMYLKNADLMITLPYQFDAALGI